MKFFLFFTTILAISFPNLSRADELGMKKYRDYTPQQIKDLSDSERNKSVPMAYTMAASRGLAPDSELAFTMDLNTLMYPAISDYTVAVTAFQKDLGDNPTKELSVGQINELQKRSEWQRLSWVNFPQTFNSYITDRVAHIEGTITILDEKIAYPINHVDVTCYREGLYCETKMIALEQPNDSSWTQSYSVIDYGTTLYKITRWENNQIDAVPTDDTACRTNSLNYNFSNKEFFEIARNNTENCDVLGISLPKLTKPRTSQIVSGEKIFKEQFSKLQEKAFSYLASDFRKRLKE